MRLNEVLVLVEILFLLPSSNEVRLLFANRRDIRLLDMSSSSITPKSSSNISTLIEKLVDVTSLDWVNSTICWTDLEDAALYCQTHSNRTLVLNNQLPSPEDMAIDWLNGHIYWTDSETNRIEVVGINPPHYRSVIVDEGMDQPRAIVVSPPSGLLFWSDWGESPRIERASMSGSGRRVLVSKDLYWPNGLALDHSNKILYWVDAKIRRISYVNYDGGERGKIGKETTGHPFALIYSSGGFFWSDWQTNSLHYLKLSTPLPRPITLSPRSPLTPMDLVDYSPRPSNVYNPCLFSPCSHLCLLNSSSTYECVCPSGIGRINSTHCKTRLEEFLLVAKSSEIRLLSLDNSDYSDIVLPFSRLRHVLAVDWDESGEFVYWTDDEKRVIERGRLDGSEQSSVISSQIIHPDGLVIDPLASNLYWTDAGTDRIEVSKLDGSYRRIIVSKQLQEPRALAIDPLLGFLFWTDWGKRPKIERSKLDGSERVTVISEGISWPNGIALDLKSEKIYWCDGKLDKIEVCSYNGRGREILASSDLPHTFGFTLLNDNLYWSDWQKRTIEKGDKKTVGQRRTIKEPISDANGLKAVKRGQWENVTNGCSNNNGGCVELCFWMGSVVKCGCRTGYEISSDNKSCFLPDAFLIFSGSSDLHRLSLNKAETDEIFSVGKVKSPYAVASWGEWVYWTESKMRAICRGKVDGTGSTEVIIDIGLLSPYGLAIDHIDNNIYWTDFSTGKVELSNFEGKFRRTLYWGVEAPRSITIHHENRHLFFSFWANVSPGIIRSELDGTDSVLFVENAKVNGLTIDGEYLYYVNIDIESICVKPLNGGGEKVLYSSDFSPFSLVVYKERLYFSSLTNNSINYISKTSNKTSSVLVHAGNVHDMTTHNNWDRDLDTRPNCSTGLTFIFRNSTKKCKCGNHYTLLNTTCIGPKEFLLLSTTSSILRIIGDSDPDEVLLNQKNARGIEWTQSLIYSDNGNVKGVEKSFEGWELAVDRSNGWIFYISPEDGSVNVTTEQGLIGTVVKSSTIPTHNLAPHSDSSSLFYVQGESIYRIRYDGAQNRRVLFSPDFPVNSISLSHESIYYSIGQSIWRSSLDGENKTLITKIDEEIGFLSVWSSYYIYFSTPTGLYLHINNSTKHLLSSSIIALKFVNLSTPISNTCANSTCSFCVNGFCSCPIPYVLSSDGRHCGSRQLCSSVEWECSSGAVGCINLSKKCDRIVDCFDGGTDESECEPSPTEESFDSDKSSLLAPFLFIFLTVVILGVILLLLYRCQMNRNKKIPKTLTTEPLFQCQIPTSHPSSSPFSELFAPHPSPATDFCSEYCSANPPPTPCSTDVCSDVLYSPTPPSPTLVGTNTSSSIRDRSYKCTNGKKTKTKWTKNWPYIPPPPSPVQNDVSI